MRLRKQAADALHIRLQQTFPEALDTVWDTQAVVIAVETLKFTPAGGHKGDWVRKASFEGVLRAEIRIDHVDDALPELLAISLTSDPMFLELPDPVLQQIAFGEAWSKARLMFKDARDVVRDQSVVSALRFDAHGELYVHDADPGRPEEGHML